MDDRLWGLPAIVIGLAYLLRSRERLKREAERGARQAGQIFPWMSERTIATEARTQYLLLRIVPVLFLVLGVLILLGVVSAR